MSLTAHLVAKDKRRALYIGKVVRNSDGTFRGFQYTGVDSEVLKDAIIRFMLDHVKDDVCLMTDERFYSLDLEGYIRANVDYGLHFWGSRSFTGD